MSIASVTEWWDRFGDTTKQTKINEMILGINTALFLNAQLVPLTGAVWYLASDSLGPVVRFVGGSGHVCGFTCPLPDNLSQFKLRIVYSNLQASENYGGYLATRDCEGTLSWNHWDNSTLDLSGGDAWLKLWCNTSSWITPITDAVLLTGKITNPNSYYLFIHRIGIICDV